MKLEKSKAGELRSPGKMRMLSGRLLDLRNLQPEDIYIEDIAWGLGRTLRYGGHIREDYTVAMHSIVMSYMVPEEYALEALLHDAAEGYIGDIIWPIKALFPEVELFENRIALQIMKKFGVTTNDTLVLPMPGWEDSFEKIEVYKKSDVVEAADLLIFQHECFSMGRPGIYDDHTEKAWLKAAREHEQWWHASTYAFLERFDQLTGANSLDVDALSKLWFSGDTFSERAVREVEQSLTELGLMTGS